jgi:hypothetical protein
MHLGLPNKKVCLGLDTTFFLKRFQPFIPLFILTYGLYLHSSFISKGPVTVDCLSLVIQSEKMLETFRLKFLFGTGYPVMVLLGGLFTAAGRFLGLGDPVFMVNMVSVIFSSFAALAFYYLVRKAAGELSAVLSAFLFLFNPIILDVSSYGINHMPSLFFFLAGLLALDHFHDKRNGRMLFLSGLCFGLMGGTRLQDLILTFPFILFFYYFGLSTRRPIDRPYRTLYLMVVVTIIAATVVLFHLPFLLTDNVQYFDQLGTFFKAGLFENFKGFFSSSLLASGQYYFWSLSWAGVAWWVLGNIYLARNNPKALALTVLWWAGPLLFYGNLITTVPRFLSVTLPGFIIPIAVLLAHFLRKNNRWGRILAGASFLFMVIQPLANTQEVLRRRHQHSLAAEFYTWIREVTPPDASIICSDDALFITYYSGRSRLEKPAGARHLTREELDAFQQELNEALGKNVPVYMTSMGLQAYDYYHEFSGFMNKHYILTAIGEKPLELWYATPFEAHLFMSVLFKVEKRQNAGTEKENKGPSST